MTLDLSNQLFEVLLCGISNSKQFCFYTLQFTRTITENKKVISKYHFDPTENFHSSIEIARADY